MTNDNMKPFIPCSKCAPKGYYWVEDKFTKCDCLKKHEAYRDLFYRIKKRGFDPSIIDYDIDTSYKGKNSLEEVKKLRLYIKGFIGKDSIIEEDSPSYKKALLYMWGPKGTQKTHLSQFIGKEFLKEGFDCYYTTIFRMIDLVADMRDKDETLVDKYLTCDLLIIDEMGNNYITKSKYELPFIDNFIRERINRGKGLILIANEYITSPVMIEKLGDNLQNFIERNILLGGQSFEMKDEYIKQVDVFDGSIGLFNTKAYETKLSGKRKAKE
jgi:DNA replication protein DnaC